MVRVLYRAHRVGRIQSGSHVVPVNSFGDLIFMQKIMTHLTAQISPGRIEGQTMESRRNALLQLAKLL